MSYLACTCQARREPNRALWVKLGRHNINISQRNDDNYVLALQYLYDILYARLQRAICLVVHMCSLGVSMTPTRQTNMKCITTSHTLQCTVIDDRYIYIPSDVHVMMTQCVGHYVIWYVIWLLLGHYVAAVRQKTGQILALFLRSMYYDTIITLCCHGHGCTDSKLRTPRGICMWDAIYKSQ
jgi:hypothetical protein